MRQQRSVRLKPQPKHRKECSSHPKSVSIDAPTNIITDTETNTSNNFHDALTSMFPSLDSKQKDGSDAPMHSSNPRKAPDLKVTFNRQDDSGPGIMTSSTKRKQRRRKHVRDRNNDYYKFIFVARYILMGAVIVVYVIRLQTPPPVIYNIDKMETSNSVVAPATEKSSTLRSRTRKDKKVYDPGFVDNISFLLEEEEAFEPGATNSNLDKDEDQNQFISSKSLLPNKYTAPNPSIAIPIEIDKFYADVSTPFSPDSEVALFWHILKSGGTSVKDMYGVCMKLVEAAGSGVMNGHGQEDFINVVQIAEGGISYVNVDTTTPEGIARATQLQLIQSGAADIIFTPLLHESTQLFAGTGKRARLFAIFRHPVERAISLFHYLRKATWEPTFNERLQKMTLEDYAISEFVEDNWMVRFLTNKREGHVTKKHLLEAKEILRRKVHVGIVLDIQGSVKRFNHLFGFPRPDIVASDWQRCADQFLSTGSNTNKHDSIEENGVGWRILRATNLYDMELYEYALQLYDEQRNIMNEFH